MKQIKKGISFLMAVILLLGCSVTSLADSTAQHTITITNEKAGHVYQAYQIFKGDLDKENKVLSNVEWGTGVDGFSLLSALKETETYKNCETAADVAEVLKEFSNDSEELDAFAQLVQNYLTLVAAGTSTEEESPYTIPVTGDGYYLIQDSGEIGTGDSYTKIILQVVKDVQVKAKADAPTLEKNIVENSELMDANNAAVGDSVEFLLTSRVPKMDGYEKYFFIIHDSLDQGLTFQPETVEIQIGGTKLEESSYQIVENDLTDGCDFEIIFKNFIQYKEQADAEISISYSATINTEAVIGNLGNANKAHLQYSNNPNVTQNGDIENPDRPGVGDVTGETPDEVTITYLTGIELVKIDDSEEAIRLKGAEFTLTGEKLNQVRTIKGVYTADENGTYYKLKDGTYTDTVPLEETKDRYESTETLYHLSTVTEWITVKEETEATAMVDGNGEIHFHGLAAGTYVIEEITAPNGYNLLEKPITVTISMEAPEEIKNGEEEAVWKYSISGAVTQNEQIAESGIVQLSVVNKAGTVLPSTGGAGIIVFYMIGVGMAIAAIAVEVKKKKMNGRD